MKVELRGEGFDPFGELSRFQRQSLTPGQHGATSCFIGTMRDFNDGDSVSGMLLEHYPEMTGRFLQRIAEQASEHWVLSDILLLHRFGLISPGDPIVLIGVWTAHRGAAFEACRFVIEELKSRAPFWKREKTPDGKRWVQANTSG